MSTRFGLRFATIVIALLGICGCSQGTNTQPGEAKGTPVLASAEINPATGEIVLPMDRFTISGEEHVLLQNANGLARSKCSKSAGVDFQVSSFDFPEIYRVDFFYGTWRKVDAERFGFVKPSTDADLAANGVLRNGAVVESPALADQADSNSQISEADWQVVEDCAKSTEAIRFDAGKLTAAGPWGAEWSEVQNVADLDERTRVAYDELDKCYLAKGLQPDPEMQGAVKGAAYDRIDEEQIAMALAVVACKDQVKLIQRLADVRAGNETPIVDKYGKELAEQRARIDQAVAEARGYLAENANPAS